MRTADSAAPLAAPAVATSLIAFIVGYFALFGAGTFYISRLMSHPPHSGEMDLGATMEGPIRRTGIVPGPAMGERRIAGAK